MRQDTDHIGKCLELCFGSWLGMDVEMWTLKMIAWVPLDVWIKSGTSGHALTQRMQNTDHTEKVFPPPASQKITGEGKHQWKQKLDTHSEPSSQEKIQAFFSERVVFFWHCV